MILCRYQNPSNLMAQTQLSHQVLKNMIVLCVCIYHSVQQLTILNVCRLPEGQHILSQRIAYLQEKLSELESSPSEAVSSIHFNIASCYHSLSSNLGHTCSALEHAQRALDLTEGDGEIEWLVQQLVRQKDAEKKKLEKEKYFLSMGNEAPSLSMPEPVQVDIYGIMKDAYTLAFVFQISRYVSDPCNHCSWCDLAPISIHTCIYL